MDRVDTLLTGLEHRGHLARHHDRCIRFMLACCQLIRHRMTPKVVEGLELAARYWAGNATRDDLDQMRIACWKEIDGVESSFREGDPRYTAGRAAICVLFPEFPHGGDSEGDQMAWCIDFANRTEDHSVEQAELLRNEFEDCLLVQ